MFSCCYMRAQSDEEDNSKLRESLISNAGVGNQLASQKKSDYDLKTQERIEKEIPVNKHLLIMSQKQISRINTIETDINLEKEVSPEQKIPRSIIKFGSFEQSQKVIKSKSQLWLEGSGTKILYECYRKQKQMIFSFKLTKIETEYNNPINYAINSCKNNKSIYKVLMPIEVSLTLVIINKYHSEIKTIIKSLEIKNYVKPIFAICKREEEQKSIKTHFESQEIYEAFLIGSNCIRVETFDKIIISCLNEKDCNSILQFCEKVTEFYDLQDLSKIQFIFPPELTLSEIHLVLSKLFRKFVISELIEKIIRYLGFHIELIIVNNIQEAIVVSNNLLMCQKEQIYKKEKEIKVQMAIGLLLIEMNDKNEKIYENVIKNFLNDMNILKYLKFIQFIHKQRKQFISKLEELKYIDSSQYLQIQNSPRIEEKTVNVWEKYISINHKTKRKIAKYFGDYRSSQTPIEESQKKKKEWDDDLKQNDIRVTIMDKNREEVNDNCNIFEQIDDSQVENANLDIIADLDFKQSD